MRLNIVGYNSIIKLAFSFLDHRSIWSKSIKWLLTVFQFANVVIVFTEVLTYFSPTIWIIFGIVLWEGLLSGCAYVNTYYRMSVEIPEDWRKFALGVAPGFDALGITLAGIFAIPAHNAICKIPMPIRN